MIDFSLAIIVSTFAPVNAFERIIWPSSAPDAKI
jgi:hypothetical protein